MNRNKPLHRRTPLSRGQQRGWNSTLRPMSAKKRKEKAETDGPRRQYAEEVGCCMVCGDTRDPETHEIAFGWSARCKAVYQRMLQMVVGHWCGCHDKLQGKGEYPPERQVAIRMRWDLETTAALYKQATGKALDTTEVLKWLQR